MMMIIPSSQRGWNPGRACGYEYCVWATFICGCSL
jgi:hypothetical protein